MSNKPLVSIIVPIYNVEKYLEKCIESLLSQDYKPLEIILVDDCSTDNSVQIAKIYSEKYADNCKLILRDENGGLSLARNTGMKYASGEWLSFVDSDDWVSKDYISSLLSVADSIGADVVIGNADYVYENGETKSANAFGNVQVGAGNKEIIALCRSYACGRIFRSSLFHDSGIFFPEDIKRSEDIGTIIPILTKAEKIGVLDKTVYYYFQRKTSISNSNKNIDLSFYPKTLQRMFDLSDRGYEEELEFRAVHEMLYGMIYLMISSGKSREDFIKHVEWFTNKFPNWKNNKYIKNLPLAKKLFVNLAGGKKYLFVKLLVKARG